MCSAVAEREQSAASERERDLSIILENRHSQMTRLGERVRHYEIALNEIIGAVSLGEARRIARRALDDVLLAEQPDLAALQEVRSV